MSPAELVYEEAPRAHGARVAARRRRPLARRLLALALPATIGLAVGVAACVAWQLLSGPVLDPFFVSRPTAIWHRLIQMSTDGELSGNLTTTLAEAGWGFLVGAVPGALMGLLLGRLEVLSKALMPYVVAFFTMPRLALAPLFVIWFGIGLNMKVALTASVVYFPVFMVTFQGSRDISEELIAIVRIMGGSRLYVFFRVILPSSLAWLFAGLKQSVHYALLGAVVGELVAANRGLGYLIAHEAGDFDTAGVFAVALVLMLLGVVSYWGLRFLERRVLRWKKSSVETLASIF